MRVLEETCFLHTAHVVPRTLPFTGARTGTEYLTQSTIIITSVRQTFGQNFPFIVFSINSRTQLILELEERVVTTPLTPVPSSFEVRTPTLNHLNTVGDLITDCRISVLGLPVSNLNTSWGIVVTLTLYNEQEKESKKETRSSKYPGGSSKVLNNSFSGETYFSRDTHNLGCR